MAHGQKVIGHVFYHPKVKNSNIFFGQCVTKSKNPTGDTVFDHPAPNCPYLIDKNPDRSIQYPRRTIGHNPWRTIPIILGGLEDNVH